MRVALFEGDELEQMWGAGIAASLASIQHQWADKWTMEYFYHSAMAGHLQVWAACDEKDNAKVIAFTTIVTYPAGRVFEIVQLFGEGHLEDALKAFDEVWTKYAHMQGCRSAEIPRARKGWERVLAGYGMKQTGVVLSRPLMGALN